MDLRTHYPYSLLRYGLIETYPSLNRNIRTHVAVIGAGITGALIGYHLQQKGINCVVLDKRHAGLGSTAASTSLIQYEIDTPLHKLVDRVGNGPALRSYELCLKAISDLRQLCIDTGTSDSFTSKCSLQFASYKKHVRDLEKEYVFRKKHGFRVDILGESDVKKDFHFKAPAALLSYEAAQADAYLLTHSLLKHLQNNDCPVYDHTEVVDIKYEKKGVRLKTKDGCTIASKQLVIACGYESGKYLSKSPEDLRCTYAMVSEPIDRKELWKDNCLIWETADPYLYLRTTADNRVLVGGKDTKYMKLASQLNILPQKTKALMKGFNQIFPHLTLKPDFSWAGAFAATVDGLPYIGQVKDHPRAWFALGYGGNGITFSLIAAQLISQSIAGKKHPDLNLFSFDR